MKTISRDKILQRIKKLLALSSSPVLAEAEEAARKAHNLLKKYNLSIQDIPAESCGICTKTYQKGFAMKKWRAILVQGIARENYCELVIFSGYKGSWRFNIVGKEHNIVVVEWMCDYLIKSVERISLNEIPRSAKTKYRESFREGMAVGIILHLKELKEKETIIPENKEIVISNNQLIKTFLKSYKLEKRNINHVPPKKAAFNKGFDSGYEIQLNAQIKKENKNGNE